MALVVRAFPVHCERADVDALVAEMHARGAETKRFYASFGVRRESWFVQEQDGQRYVIGVTDVPEPVQEKAQAYAATDDEFARWFQQKVLEMSGVDQREQPLGPPSAQIFDSTGGQFQPEAALSVRMYPLPNGADALHEFAEQLKGRFDEASRFYDSFDITESWFLQDLGEKPYVIGVTSMRGDVEGNLRRYQSTTEPFVAWFKKRVVEVTGIDPNVTPLGPPSEQVFDFRG